MKALIVYFSATGNTQYGVQLVKHGIEKHPDDDCGCVEIKDFSLEMIHNYDLVGFACPVFAYKPTLIMLDLIEKLPHSLHKPCFTFVSYAGDLSNTNWILKKKLEQHGCNVIAQHAMLAQGSWTVARSPGGLDCENEPTAQTQQGVIDFGSRLRRILAHYNNSTLEPLSPDFHFTTLHFISYFYNDYVLDHLFTIDVNPAVCTRCGRCVRNCPTSRMKLEEFPHPRGKCIGCYRCINMCPENAIESWFTKGKLRYKGLDPSIKLLGKGNGSLEKSNILER